MQQQPTEPHLAVRRALAIAILNSRTAIKDNALIRSAERLLAREGLGHSAG